MVKLNFKAYEKLIKYFLIIFFLYKKMSTGYHQKTKERLSKKACERYQNLSEEGKKKSANMLVSDIESF